jgi:hypothetical protein
MKTYLLLLAGILVGGVVAFWTFTMLFNASLATISPTVALPVGLAAVVSFVLAWIEPKKWKLLAASVALPTLLMSALLLIMLWTESRNDWGWVLVAAITLCVCVIPAWFAPALKVRWPNSSFQRTR